jgi:hypothetical protein
MDEQGSETDANHVGCLLTDGAGNTDDEETDEAKADEEEADDETEKTDTPPSPPRNSTEGQTQAPERDEEDLIDTRTTANENETTDDDEIDNEEGET